MWLCSYERVVQHNQYALLPQSRFIHKVAPENHRSKQQNIQRSIPAIKSNGMGSVIDLLTGLPIDYEVLSNFFQKCNKIYSEKPDDPEWKGKHKNNCPKNFDGSAGAIEVEASVRPWGRSLDCHKLRYTTILSDGDSKDYDAIKKMDLYGPDIKIDKEDCVNHVSKRMGTTLRNIVAISKAQKESISGKGKLTQEKMTKIQNYHGRAITLF